MIRHWCFFFFFLFWLEDGKVKAGLMQKIESRERKLSVEREKGECSPKDENGFTTSKLALFFFSQSSSSPLEKTRRAPLWEPRVQDMCLCVRFGTCNLVDLWIQHFSMKLKWSQPTTEYSMKWYISYYFVFHHFILDFPIFGSSSLPEVCWVFF